MAFESKYEEFNRKLKQWPSTTRNVLYADVRTLMLHSGGEVRKDLFIEDHLHMNRKGYEIWKNVLTKFVN